MQLAGDGFVHLDAEVLQTAHAGIFVQNQIELAAKVGIQNYLQSQMGELS